MNVEEELRINLDSANAAIVKLEAAVKRKDAALLACQRERDELAAKPCELVHCACGACGKNITDAGTCGCEDIKTHPIGRLYRHKLEKQIADLEAERDRLAAEVERLRAMLPPSSGKACWLCKKEIYGKVHYQGGSLDHPSHEGCLVTIGGA